MMSITITTIIIVKTIIMISAILILLQGSLAGQPNDKPIRLFGKPKLTSSCCLDPARFGMGVCRV